ncbi:MAG: carboxypeptidase-like regulatory domain-containing protein [Xenococcus sp. (in: cyanobacteria)]
MDRPIRIKWKLLLFCVLALEAIAYSQNEAEWIKGRLLDKGSREPIVFATVIVEGTNLGVISNDDGHFQIPNRSTPEDGRLIISSMGYRSQKIRFSEFEPGHSKEILMTQSVIQLEEAVITSKAKRLSAKEIVANAISNIETNYPIEAFSYVGYYRDYQLSDNSYQNLNEAIIEVNEKGFHLIDTVATKFRLLELRRNSDFTFDSFAAKSYDYRSHDKTIPNAIIDGFTTNEFLILRVHDPVRNNEISAFSFVDRFISDFIPNHRLKKLPSTSYDETKVYRISVQKRTSNAEAKGTLYIDQDDFSIRRFDYEVLGNPIRNRRSISSHYERPSMGHEKMRDLIFKLSVEYREGPKNKMYLNYISFQNEFNLIYPPEFKVDEVVLNPTLKQLEVQLNKAPANWEEIRFKDFNLRYRGRMIKLSKVIDQNQLTYLLKVDAEQSKQRSLLRQLFSKTEDPQKSSLEIQIKGIKDNQGNLLGERKRKSITQYREFFVQEILKEPEIEAEAQEGVMIKNRPLFDSIQPILRDSIPIRYWMNSPLQRD